MQMFQGGGEQDCCLGVGPLEGSSDLEDPTHWLTWPECTVLLPAQLPSSVHLSLAVPCSISAGFCNPSRLMCNNLLD